MKYENSFITMKLIHLAQLLTSQCNYAYKTLTETSLNLRSEKSATMFSLSTKVNRIFPSGKAVEKATIS